MASFFRERFSTDHPTATLELIRLVSTPHAATSARHCPSITATSPSGFSNASRLGLTTVPPSSAGGTNSVGVNCDVFLNVQVCLSAQYERNASGEW
jgi:hypothetical protein